jgi:hypothetical protein
MDVSVLPGETIEVNQLEWSVRYNAVLLMEAFDNLLYI